MANSEIIELLMQTTSEFFLYMLPVIAFMAGVVFITSFLFDVTINAYKKTRR